VLHRNRGRVPGCYSLHSLPPEWSAEALLPRLSVTAPRAGASVSAQGRYLGPGSLGGHLANGVGAGAPTYATTNLRGSRACREAASGSDEDMKASEPALRPTRRRDLRGARVCSGAAPGNGEDHTACHPCRRGRRRSQATSTASPPASSRARASAPPRPRQQRRDGGRGPRRPLPRTP
jgi:hypothetical protein